MRLLAIVVTLAVVAGAVTAAEPALAAWTAALGSDVPRVRAHAAVALGRLGEHAAVPALTAALSDPDARVRCEAAKALGMLKDPRPAAPLTKCLQDADVNVRFCAAYALGEIRVPASATALLSALLEDADPGVRGQAAWALRELRQADLAGPLLAGLRRETADAPRLAWLLKHLDSPGVVPGLQDLARDADAGVRRRALVALVEIGGEAASDGCLAALSDPQPQVRLAAVQGLLRLRSARVTDTLRRHLDHESDGAVREAIQTALPPPSAGGGRVAHWSFDERDTARARDVTGRGPDGEVKGCTVVEGKVGAALRFAEGAHIALGKPDGQPLQDTPFTIMAWVRPEAPTGVIVARGGAYCGYALYLKDGKPAFGIHRERDGPAYIAAGTAVLADGWVHLAGVADAAAIRLYVNGRLAAETPIPGLIPTTPGQGMEIGVDLGTSPAEITDAFTGAIDEVSVYDMALTPERLAAEAGRH